jgi:hypothetical protein
MSTLSWWRDRWVRVLLTVLLLVAVVAGVFELEHRGDESDRKTIDKVVEQLGG